MADKVYNCFVAVCKTADCNTLIVMQTLDEVDPRNPPTSLPLIPPCKDFPEFCGRCKESHIYSQLDIDVTQLANQKPGVVAHSFARARLEAEREIEARENEPH